MAEVAKTVNKTENTTAKVLNHAIGALKFDMQFSQAEKIEAVKLN